VPKADEAEGVWPPDDPLRSCVRRDSAEGYIIDSEELLDTRYGSLKLVAREFRMLLWQLLTLTEDSWKWSGLGVAMKSRDGHLEIKFGMSDRKAFLKGGKHQGYGCQELYLYMDVTLQKYQRKYYLLSIVTTKSI